MNSALHTLVELGLSRQTMVQTITSMVETLGYVCWGTNISLQNGDWQVHVFLETPKNESPLDSRFRGNDGKECGNDGKECGNDGEECGNGEGSGNGGEECKNDNINFNDKPKEIKQSITIGDCARVDKQLRAMLNVEIPSGKYTLEVSSPGIERPLLCWEHYHQYQGYQIQVSLRSLNQGRRRFIGKLLRAQPTELTFMVEERELVLSLNDIAKAHLCQ